MQEIVKKLMDEANLDEAVADKVMAVVMDFLGDKLPAPILNQVEKVLQGKSGGVDLGGAAEKLKGLF